MAAADCTTRTISSESRRRRPTLEDDLADYLRLTLGQLLGHASSKMLFEVHSRWIEDADKDLERGKVEVWIRLQFGRKSNVTVVLAMCWREGGTRTRVRLLP